ncbi:sensor histidine kinase [Candidatus Tisiphia endosymbiont of Hybos culiciformis]|uniref:sensor histidine kinase n=1 Tax=Candidatus Tisiphia endosymbiont of Hybos culiciformis TaxID=3139331 RepID=UPI003CCB3C3F
MPTDIKNQQENKQNKSTNENNNISRDIIIELQQNILIHQDFIKNTALNTKASCNNIWHRIELLHEVVNSQINQFSADIADYAKELFDYSQNILDFTECYSSSTTSTSVIPIISERFYPFQLIENVIAKLVITSKYKGIKLENHFGNLPSCLIGDSFRIKTILTQLISNAIIFTEQDSIILTSNFFAAKTLEPQNDKDILQFVIHNTAIGLSEEMQQYLYKQLNSLDGSLIFTSSTNNGKDISESSIELGLGLNLIKQFIYELNGKIDISSMQGKGTIVILQIPVTLHSAEDFNNDEINNV